MQLFLLNMKLSSSTPKLYRTSAQLKAYLQTFSLPNASDRDLDKLLKLYFDDITQGSPFDTGNSSALTPQFKRIAAFQGDSLFHATRRFLLQHRSSKQATWSFRGFFRHFIRRALHQLTIATVSKRLKSLHILGSVSFLPLWPWI